MSTMGPPAAGRPDGTPAAPHAERLEFVRAFIEHARAQPSPDRPVARPHTALLVASTAVIGALLFGLVMGLFKGGGARPAGTPQAAKTGPTSYTAVTGWDCRSAEDHTFEAKGRTPEWATVRDGAWAADGCRGSFTTVPMSSDPNIDDPSQSLVWAFLPGTGVQRCEVAVYAPKISGDEFTPATKAQFTVTAGRDGASQGTFQLNQAARSGDWQAAGAFPVTNGKFTVRLNTRGKPGSDRERLIVSQVRITCGLADK
ncbi:hypothetical protein JOD64_000714 [Micromonospora luteifusca]|uniref:Uncharacterized protein n=1 Tax=Micromonospora luteifusca TaxID=709860 RepID=A0ABS2LN00_9ACTN|nr:hypothetical protein [Micromonospora luteifusca]MBM7489492.1 hypothetical protein [Micromonospora luteifusca]